ncbi:MAG: acetyl-CoA/propionyl-CoA carboxylase, biotin carboxylase, biotin carboxyl carrier protein [Actinomycetota bacterium]|nr:acetyl-CoA/propionyl-CoA carboxylase, biotin carboxylase, biotin carboxyl carrier protein [Actinomycetota bacterium]
MQKSRNPHHIPTVLVANRGEIAVRVFRTVKRMGLRSAAVYSEADAGAPFVRMADAAYSIGPAPAAQSYLRADRILEAAKALKADLIHPGFGFLSEDASFGRAVEAAGLAFVGPPPDVLAAMGGKDEAKRIAEAAGVPVLPGYGGDDQDDAALERAAKEIGYPLIVKPAAGGGGKGMAVVRREDDLLPALASARRVAAGAFGDTKLLLERYLPAPRHVEVQVMADAFGNVIHLGERDCSLQRRHQKILEESPSPAVDATLRKQLTDAAVALCRHVGYRNAGTCEFLVDEDGILGGSSGGGAPRVFGFIEMNARLQVEHPVTEMVTGLDLVELQLRVAMGEALPLTQEDVTPTGHAIEVRLYAEDPDAGFLPQSGRLLHLRWPDEARVDSGVDEGAEVTTHYDPMLAKVIVHADDRPAALQCLSAALAETEVLGLRTNLPFLRTLATDETVAAGKVTTTWLESAYAGWTSGVDDNPVPEPAIALAGAAEAARILAGTAGPAPESGTGAVPPRDRSALDPWSTAGPWRHLEPGPTHVIVQAPTEGTSPVSAGERLVDVRGRGPFRVGDAVLVQADAAHEPDGTGCLRSGHGWAVFTGPEAAEGTRAAAVATPGLVHVFWAGQPYELPLGIRPRLVDAEGGPAQLGAPMPGTVIAVKVATGDAVERGQTLVVVEAMKMELEVKAPADGTVSAVLCAAGEAVKKGQPLVALEGAAE